MTRPIDWDETVQEFDTIAGDRRRDKRYGLELELRWRLIRRRRVLESGEGRTVDVSSGGILFDAGRPLPAGLDVELSVAWPVMLHNMAQLQLVVHGKIVRSDGRRTAVRMVQHEFRTAGTAAERHLALASGARPATPLLSRVSGAPGLVKPN
ncbi:MAG: PilZ domain-containing protein [Bryobacteraceae bacterium]|jgi:c-di-GMP-binding flagellar brake protein YcgR